MRIKEIRELLKNLNDESVLFKSNGTKMYVVYDNKKKVDEYEFTVPWKCNTRFFKRTIKIN